MLLCCRRIRRCTSSFFAGLAGLRYVTDPPYGEANFQSFWIELHGAFALDRESVLEHLAARGISACSVTIR